MQFSHQSRHWTHSYTPSPPVPGPQVPSPRRSKDRDLLGITGVTQPLSVMGGEGLSSAHEWHQPSMGHGSVSVPSCPGTLWGCCCCKTRDGGDASGARAPAWGRPTGWVSCGTFKERPGPLRARDATAQGLAGLQELFLVFLSEVQR